MHDTAMAWLLRSLDPRDITGKAVVEAGSMNVNGSVRPFVESLSPLSYLGTDMRPGPGVDQVLEAENLAIALGPATADVVICTEMLEHARYWRGAIMGMVGVLSPGGVLMLTTRGPGFPRHGYPGDYWRFTTTQFAHIIASAQMDVEDLQEDPVPGVLVKARKPAWWTWPRQFGRELMLVRPQEVPAG